jgi:hypothetical protein
VTCLSHHIQVTKTSRLTHPSSSYLPSAHIFPSIPADTCTPAMHILIWPNYGKDDTIFKHYGSYSGHISIYFSVLKIIWIIVRTKMLQKLKTHAKLNTKICHLQAHINIQTSTQFLITLCIMPTILSAIGSTGILLQWDVGCLRSTKAGTVNPLLTAGPPPPLEPAKERRQMLKLVLSNTKYHISTRTEHCT